MTAVREIGPHCYTSGRITDTLMPDYAALVIQPPGEVARAPAQGNAGKISFKT